MTPVDVAGHGPLAYQSGSYSMMNGSVPTAASSCSSSATWRNWKIEYTSWSSDLPPQGKLTARISSAERGCEQACSDVSDRA